MGDFNHGDIKWDTLQSLCLVHDNFLTQHVLEPTRATRVLDIIVLSSQKESIVIQKPLGSSDHNQLHINIKITSDKTKVKQCRRDLGKETECWNILRGELDSAIDRYVPMKNQGKRSKKKHLSKEAFIKIRYKHNINGFINIRDGYRL